MEPEKPFKTIEVLDSQTRQLCKIACMSCIRGHRTTSCGIPVCRTKIFWTVKRPGRPSNSCNCRFGPSGRCQCVVAKPTCTHKPRKGEKRSVECRCDEMGRFCCLLEPEHWDALCALQKPTVDFFPSREALEARHIPATIAQPFLGSPAYMPGTPQMMNNSVPGTPQPLHFVNATEETFLHPQASPAARIVPRFGMMGVGAPLGNDFHGQDVLIWDGQSPEAPRDFLPYSSFKSDPPNLQQAAPFNLAEQQPPSFNELSFSPPPVTTTSGEALTAGAAIHPDFEKLISDYVTYQFPSAICQHCGMNGCTCRNCPAVMQNFESGSWAQCCSRKHVTYPSTPTHATTSAEGGCCGSAGDSQMLAGASGPNTVFTEPMQVDHELKMLDVDGENGGLDLNEFLLADLEQDEATGSGCCGCGG